MKKTEPYIPANGTEGDWFEAKHCCKCANYIHVKEFDASDCNKGLLTKAWWTGKAPEWFQIWEDGEHMKTGCKQFVDISIRSDRSKQAHVTMKDNYYNDPRQMRMFDELD